MVRFHVDSRVPLALLAALLLVSGCGRKPDATETKRTEVAAVAAALERVESNLRVRRPCKVDDFRLLQAANRNDPADLRVRRVLQAVYVQREDWQALVDLQLVPSAARTAADDLLLAKLYIKLGRYRAAAALLVPLATADSNVELARLAGHALFYAGDSEGARPLLERARTGAPSPRDAAEPATLGALIAFYGGDSENAALRLREVVRLVPDYRPAHNALGRVLAARGDAAGATRHFATASALQERESGAEKRQATLASRARDLNAARSAQRHTDAEAIIAAMLPIAEPALQAELYRALAEVLRASGRDVEAHAAAARADSLARGKNS